MWKEYLTGTALLTALLGLLIYYALELPLTYSLIYGLVVTVAVVMAHEAVHQVYGDKVCGLNASFKVNELAITLFVISVTILLALIFLDKYLGFKTYLIPILASPGAVYVDMKANRNCIDNMAIAPSTVNFFTGVLGLAVLYQIADPPYAINAVSATGLLAIISYFSFILAMINSLPIPPLDGYNAVKYDTGDLVVLGAVVMNVVVSAVIIFVLKPFVVVLGG